MNPAAEISIKLYNIAKTCDANEKFSDVKKSQMINLLNLLPTLKGQDLRIYPLLYQKSLHHKVVDKLTNKAHNLLKQASYAASADHLRKKAFIQSLIPLLEENQLDIILLKSAAFNGTIYSDQHPRFAVDLDILVKQEEKEKAVEVFSKVATRVWAKKRYPLDDLCEYSFTTNNNSNLCIDLHFKLTYPHLHEIQQSQVWRCSEEHPEYKSKFIRILTPEHSLSLLATNMIKDLNIYHHTLLDTHEICIQQKPDIDKTFALAKIWGTKHAVYFLLSTCHKHLGTPVNTSQLEKYKPTFIYYKFGRLVLDKIHRLNLNEKSIRHRIVQIITQTVLADRIISSARLQLLFIKSAIRTKALQTHNLWLFKLFSSQ